MKLLKWQRQFKKKRVFWIPHLLQGGTRLFNSNAGLPSRTRNNDFDGEEKFRAQEKELRRTALCMCVCVCVCVCVYVCTRVLASIWGDGENSLFQTSCFCLICLLPATVMYFPNTKKIVETATCLCH